ncbi:MAG: response regulator [Acidobacteriia bacterium]|nr:response regulator [Terriglobia bacterium]
MKQTPDAANQANIIIVDDTAANLEVLAGMLKDSGHRARPLPSGKLALQAAENSPPDLILLDIMMPEMDGFEVCRQLKANPKLREIPVIFISALSETMDKVKAFGAGAVDYVTKPFQFEEVRVRVETHLKLRRMQVALEAQNRHLEDLVREQVREISDSQMITIFALAKLAESRDSDTGKHLERIQIYCRLLATKLKEDPHYSESITQTYVDNLFHASPLHDIGKVAIPDSILLKPGRLSPEEFEIMKTHSTLGARTLEAVRAKYPRNAFINMGIAIARSHHEKWDGSGYPNGLAGEDIPLAARIVAVADYYDAVRFKRCYKAAATHEEACEILLAGSGAHFSPRIVEAFRELAREFREVREKIAD